MLAGLEKCIDGVGRERDCVCDRRERYRQTCSVSLDQVLLDVGRGRWQLDTDPDAGCGFLVVGPELLERGLVVGEVCLEELTLDFGEDLGAHVAVVDIAVVGPFGSGIATDDESDRAAESDQSDRRGEVQHESCSARTGQQGADSQAFERTAADDGDRTFFDALQGLLRDQHLPIVVGVDPVDLCL